MRLALLLLLALLAAAPARAQAPLELVSPDGANRIAIGVNAQGTPTYGVSRGGSPVLAPSPIVLDLDVDSLGYGMTLTGSDRTSADATYPIVAGKAAQGRDQYNQLTVHF